MGFITTRLQRLTQIKGGEKEKKKRFIYTQVILGIMRDDDVVMVKVERSTREALKKRGIKGETYDIIIRRLLEEKK